MADDPEIPVGDAMTPAFEPEIVTELLDMDLPYKRRVELRDVDYRNGLHMLRLIWREGRRLTQVEVDPANVATLARAMLDWAERHMPDTPEAPSRGD